MSEAEAAQPAEECMNSTGIPFWVYGATTFCATYLFVHLHLTGTI